MALIKTLCVEVMAATRFCALQYFCRGPHCDQYHRPFLPTFREPSPIRKDGRRSTPQGRLQSERNRSVLFKGRWNHSNRKESYHESCQLGSRNRAHGLRGHRPRRHPAIPPLKQDRQGDRALRGDRSSEDRVRRASGPFRLSGRARRLKMPRSGDARRRGFFIAGERKSRKGRAFLAKTSGSPPV
jgi:hypothetical protein